MAQMSSPGIMIKNIDADQRESLKKNFPMTISWLQVKPANQLLPPQYPKFSEKICQFKFREKDIVLLSYPKTGTTWMSEILWAMSNIDDLHLAEEESLVDRVFLLHNDILRPFKEGEETSHSRKFRATFPDAKLDGDFVLPLANVAPDRRVIRTHLMPSLLHPDLFKTCKVAYVVRNPKDSCLSYYKHMRAVQYPRFLGDFSEFTDLYMTEMMMPFGTFWNHVRQIWEWRDHPNFHLVFYEDLKRNLMGEMEKLNEFFGFHLSHDQLQKVSEYTSLENMKRREAKVKYIANMDGSFFNDGKIGSWADVATEDLDLKINSWTEEESRGIDIKFKY